MRNKKINKKIIKLWNKYFHDTPEVHAPAFYDNFKQNGFLFIGLNPSFSTEGFKKILHDTEYEKINPDHFLRWENILKNQNFVDDCIKIENYAYKKYDYFKRFREIGAKHNLPWQHIDLFLFKETEQNTFLNWNKNNKIFAHEQLEIFDEILSAIKPLCIVIANAEASRIFQKYYEKQIRWDNNRGFDWFTHGDKEIPIFFSSIVKVLDAGSYKRLDWHISQAIK